MSVTDAMFPNDKHAGRHSLIFMAGFHIGIPFAIYHPRAHSKWKEIKLKISQQISQGATLFKVVQMEYDPETNFPIGTPLAITHEDFFKVFRLPNYFRVKRTFSQRTYKLDHLIWICPTGVVLVMAQISFTNEKIPSLAQLEKIVEKHYAELSFVFIQVAAVIFADISIQELSPLLCSKEDVDLCKQAINYNGKLVPSDTSSRGKKLEGLGDSISNNPEIHSLYERIIETILVDVYFIHFEAAHQESISIGYVHSSIRFRDRSHLPVLGIGFSIFVELLWIQKQLRTNLRMLQRGIIGMSQPKDESDAQLRLFRIFARLFVDESSPISVRLKARYMTRLEEFWKAERMDALVEQINGQLETLQTMFDWIQEGKSAALTLKLTVAGIFFTVLSVTSVVGTLISTFDPDPSNQIIHIEWRIALVLGSLAISAVLLAWVLRIRPSLLIRKMKQWISHRSEH